jgi:hypothetical protein
MPTDTEKAELVASIGQARERVDQLDKLLDQARAVRDVRMLVAWQREVLPSEAAKAGGVGYQRFVNIRQEAEAAGLLGKEPAEMVELLLRLREQRGKKGTE